MLLRERDVSSRRVPALAGDGVLGARHQRGSYLANALLVGMHLLVVQVLQEGTSGHLEVANLLQRVRILLDEVRVRPVVVLASVTVELRLVRL